MSVHESSVNFKNLIRDLADVYPLEVPEVVVIELVANCLDAKATRISIDYDADQNTLVVEDNGEGMTKNQFEEYHDFAAGLKTKGGGIGFAGVGAKISFNDADRVITETRSKSFSGGSNWYLQSGRKLIWEDIQPKHLSNSGTRVEVHFRSSEKPSYHSSDNLLKLLHRHYLPLFDIRFLDLYKRCHLYSDKLRFVLNGKEATPINVVESFALLNTREFTPKARGKRVGYGVLGVAKDEYPIGSDVVGVLICTYGKVVKGELFNQFPSNLGPRLFGMVEIPDLAEFLTTSKTDFVRRGRARKFERLYDPVRQEFRDWLRKIGVQTAEAVGTDEATKLERELKKIIEEVPELSDFFGFRTRKTVLQPGGELTADLEDGVDSTFPDGNGTKGKEAGPVGPGDEPGQALVENEDRIEKAKPISRRGRRGPKISFSEDPDRLELAWVEGNNVVINSGHPSYLKVGPSSTARRFYNLFAIASAIQRFLGSEVETPDMMFIDRMMAAWGSK